MAVMWSISTKNSDLSISGFDFQACKTIGERVRANNTSLDKWRCDEANAGMMWYFAIVAGQNNAKTIICEELLATIDMSLSDAKDINFVSNHGTGKTK